MPILADKWYDGRVESDELDTRHQGAVRVSILGVTDGLNDPKDLPWASPMTNELQSVPVKGTTLRIIFDNGDIHCGRYVAQSADMTPLPSEYVKEYPSVAVGYLGDSRFIMTHNRQTPLTVITHPSDSTLTWDNNGRVTLTSDRAYSNTGIGAMFGSENGSNVHPVLTEATIDVFCCTPVGNYAVTGAFQGSEYLWASHMSRDTYDRINGAVTPSNSSMPLDITQTPPQARTLPEASDSVVQAMTLAASSPVSVQAPAAVGAVTSAISSAIGGDVKEMDITFAESPNYVEGADRNTPIIICTMSGKSYSSFTKQVGDMMRENMFASHYVIGKVSNEDDNESGSIQLVDLDNTALHGFTSQLASNAIIVRFIGNAEADLTKYQVKMLTSIYTKVKDTYDLPKVKVMNIANVDGSMITKSGNILVNSMAGNFDNMVQVMRNS